MNEFIEKLIGRLEEETYDMEICEEQFDMNSPYFMDVEYKMVKFDDVKDIVNQLAEEHKGGWIPCIEKQPPKPIFGEDTYLVQESDVVEPFSAYWNGEYWTNVLNDKMENVLAWRPLPEPYNTEGE